MAVMASWALTSFPLGAEDEAIFCTQTETYFSRSLLGLTSCQLLFLIFTIHVVIFRFFHDCQRFLSKNGGPRINIQLARACSLSAVCDR